MPAAFGYIERHFVERRLRHVELRVADRHSLNPPGSRTLGCSRSAVARFGGECGEPGKIEPALVFGERHGGAE